MSRAPFSHLVFDLDDTLLDTSGQLIPVASRESCVAMIEAGLNGSIEDCLHVRDELVRTPLRYDLYTNMVSRFGVHGGATPEVVAQKGYIAFHEREVENHISLFNGAREILQDLKLRYRLHLLTAGNRPTQEAKIRILRLHPLFESIHHADPSRGEKKSIGFRAIQAMTQAAPEAHLSIGNRLDTDIGEAKLLGWKTCWMRYGEYANIPPVDIHEVPDFEISEIGQLVNTCRL